MLRRPVTLGVALLISSASVAAQQRGTVELGGFGSVGTFDRDIGLLDKGFGGGLRVGIFLHPRLAIESEWGEMKASRELEFEDVNVGILSARLLGTLFGAGKKLSIHVGAGAATSTETNRVHSYGLHGLVGARIALGDKAALRIDGVMDFLANYDYNTYKRLLAGVSFTRSPFQRVRVDTVPPTRIERITVRDTVRITTPGRIDTVRVTMPGPTTAPVIDYGSIDRPIYFDFDRSVLTDSARRVLDEKVPVFQANPTMRIMIIGHADPIGGTVYNLNLGLRRAESAKAYLITKGIDGARIETVTRGESQPVVNAGNDKRANAPNRRDEFRVMLFGSSR